jgi:hypothetical protein
VTLDRVRVMRTGRFKNYLEVVLGRPSLSLEVAFNSRYEPLTGAIGSLTAVAVAGYYGNVTGSQFLPLLATLSAFPAAFDGALCSCGPATTGGCSRIS